MNHTAFTLFNFHYIKFYLNMFLNITKIYIGKIKRKLLVLVMKPWNDKKYLKYFKKEIKRQRKSSGDTRETSFLSP